MINQAVLREYYQVIKNKISMCHFDTAMAIINKMLGIFPKDEHAYYYKGVCEFALNNYKSSVRYYTIAIQINPGYAKAYFNLGVSYFVLNRYDFALINFAKALLIFTKQKELDKKQRCIEAIRLIEKKRKG